MTRTPNLARSTRRSRVVLTTLLAVLTAVVMIAPPAVGGIARSSGTPVLIATTTATLTGSVRGVNQISGFDGPLAGAVVTVFRARDGVALRYLETDAAGRYRASGLPAVAVKIRVVRSSWLTTYVNGQQNWATAGSLTLRAGQATVAPPVLVYAAAAISGEVLGMMDPVVGGAKVTVFDADTGLELRSVVSDFAGRYRVGQLPPGPIKVRATLPGWITDWANDQDTWATANVFTLKAGQVLRQSWSPTPMLYLDLAPGGVIEGSILGADGDPLGSEAPVADLLITVYDATTGKAVRYVRTDPEGDYRATGLRTGRYKVQASGAGWVSTFAYGTDTWGRATVLDLGYGETVSMGEWTIPATD